MKRVGSQDADQGSMADTASVGTSSCKGSLNEETHLPKWEDSTTGSSRVKLMCSHGGKILPRPHDNQLRYVGGETRIVVVSRSLSYGELVSKLSKLFGEGVIIKYQLPNEDLDALISVTCDEDVENMMEECDRLQTCNRSLRLRLFLFPKKVGSESSLSDLLERSMNREHWFVDALNGLSLTSSKPKSETSSVVSEVPDYLSGLDGLDDWNGINGLNYNANQGVKSSAPDYEKLVKYDVEQAISSSRHEIIAELEEPTSTYATQAPGITHLNVPQPILRPPPSHLQRQASDPVVQTRVSTLYRDHPTSQHALPSRFKASVQPFRPANPYPVTTHFAYVDPIYTHNHYIPPPSIINPFVDDKGPAPLQDRHAVMDPRLQGRQYIIRN